MRIRDPFIKFAEMICACLIGAFLISPSFSWAQETPVTSKRMILAPNEVRDDFQGEGLGQWASYPPAQDIGYEPSISPTSDFGAPGGRSLMRVVKPNRAGDSTFRVHQESERHSRQ